MSHPHSSPTRTLPEKPSFSQLRKQAKELLKAYRAGEAAAVAEVERFEWQPDPTKFALADAQRVLARSYGFSSWTSLKEQVEGVTLANFSKAVKAGDVATVRKLAKARPELVNSQGADEFDESIALHLAVVQGDAKMTRVLMELDADAWSGIWPHRDATTAYTIARDRGYDEIVAIIEQAEERRRRALSSSGATIGSKTDEIQKAILEGRCDDAKRILESDLALVGACNLRGATPLHVAAWTHTPEMIQWLLERQASVDAKDGQGKTPLDYAAMVAGWSAHGRHYHFMENFEKPPAMFHETVRLLRSQGAELTPRAAVAIGDQEAVLQMHREGRLKNDIHSLRGGLITIAVRVNRIDMVALLLDLGLDPDEAIFQESWGMPLWFASMCGRHEIAELLLKRGADVNAIVFASGDALGNACDEEMKALLLKHGARITVEQVPDRETAKAILAGTLRAYSLNVVDPTPTDLAEQMLWASVSSDPEIVQMCLPHMKRPRDDPWWNYVLIHAALPECCQLILDHGVNPDVLGSGGFTILHHLATDYVKEAHRLTRATMLLDAGASLTKRDPLLKSTPLGWACRWGRPGLVHLYLERGADAREMEAEPWARPLAWATKGGHTDIADVLRAHGAK